MPNKKVKLDKKETGGSSSDDDMSYTEDIDVDFEAFGICDKDTDGIINLLKRAFSNEDLDVVEIASILTHQNGRGCIFMTALDDGEEDASKQGSSQSDNVDQADNDIYGVVSFINLKEHRNKTCVKQIKGLIQKHSERIGDIGAGKKFDDLLKNLAKEEIALIINERLANLPYHIALPAFQALQTELNATRPKIDQFLMFVKVQKLSIGELPQSSKSKKQPVEKTKRKRTASSVDSEAIREIFVNAEEEFLAEECSLQLEFECSGEERSDSGLKCSKRLLVFDRTTLDRFVEKLQDDIRKHCS